MGCLRGLLWLVVIVVGLGVVGGLMGIKPGNRTSPEVVAGSTILPQVNVTPPFNTWRAASNKSRIDDSTSEYLVLQSTNDIAQRFGGSAPATLTLRCHENTTAALFEFAGQFMADIQSYGQITYRIDDRKAQTRSFRESTDNSALGLWSGGEAIPFAKAMFGATTLYVRATPFNESPVEAEFNIAGLEDRIGALRKACGW